MWINGTAARLATTLNTVNHIMLQILCYDLFLHFKGLFHIKVLYFSGLSVTPVTIAPGAVVEFQNKLSFWRYNPTINNTEDHFDVTNYLWWMPNEFWNKGVNSPSGDRVVRIVGSVWGEGNSVRTCGKFVQFSV